MKLDESTDVVIDARIDIIPKTPLLRMQTMDYGPGIPDGQKQTVFTCFLPDAAAFAV